MIPRDNVRVYATTDATPRHDSQSDELPARKIMSKFSLFVCSQRISNTLHVSPNRTFAETRLLTGLAGRGCRGGLPLGSASTRIEPPSLYHLNTHVSPAFLLSVSLHTSSLLPTPSSSLSTPVSLPLASR